MCLIESLIDSIYLLVIVETYLNIDVLCTALVRYNLSRKIGVVQARFGRISNDETC